MKRNELPKLIKEIQSGSDDAFAQLYHEFYTSFFYMALKLTNNEADAHDVVQDTFISIQANINHLKNEEVAIVWMKRILLNRCKNLFRKNRDIYMDEGALAKMEMADEREGSVPDEMIRKQSDREVVLSLLANIPFIYRAPLVLKYYDDAKMSEIASVLDIPVGTVKSRLRTGKKLLREQIRQYEERKNEKVPFHFLPTGLFLFLEFHKSDKKESMNDNLRSGSYSGMLKLALCTILAISGSAGIIVFGYHAWHQQDHSSPADLRGTGLSDQEAYFLLRREAHCEEDLKAMSREELDRLKPYVDQLKINKGPFYELLDQDEWLFTYEKLRNK